MTPQEMKVIVIGPFVWGKGDTLDEALANAVKSNSNRKFKEYLVYICHPDTKVADDGALVYPSDFPPKKIHEQRIKSKAKKATK